MQYPTFHCLTACKLIEIYTAYIDWDKASDTFTLRDKDTWLLTGICTTS